MRTKLTVGVNTLDVCFPKVAAEWDYERNGTLSPSGVTAKSGKKVWWRCDKGHEWEAAVCNRTLYNTKCPYCSGKYAIKGETDLETLRPDLASEWDYERNIGFSPSDFTVNSSEKVWWQDKEGHRWMAVISNRSSGSGYMYSSGGFTSRTRLV